MKNQPIKNIVFKLRLLYPIWIVLAVFSIAYVPSVIFVENDILKTSNNIVENEWLFRLSIVGSLATGVVMVYVSFYLYLLFEKTNKARAILMLILAMASIPFMGFDVFKIISFDCTSADCMYNYLNLSRNGQIIAEVFWGLWLYPLGKLVIESNYLPKFLGYALIASCIGYLFGVLIKIMFPGETNLLIISDTLAFGELVFALWFVFRGIKPS